MKEMELVMSRASSGSHLEMPAFAGEPSAELHVYERCGHGFDLNAEGATSDQWFDQFMGWMKARGLLTKE